MDNIKTTDKFIVNINQIAKNFYVLYIESFAKNIVNKDNAISTFLRCKFVLSF